MRLLIVDDDYQIRTGMQHGIEWETIGITEVDTCANGLDALAAIQDKWADIIIADIQMPGMTGLEMIKRVRELSGSVRVIFISAYSEFEYCRQALLMGANDYVLKPIQMDEFMEVIRKNVRALKEEKEQDFRHKKAVTEQIIRKICEGQPDADFEQLREILTQEAPFLQSDYFILSLVRFDKTLSAHKKREAENILSDYADGWMFPAAETDTGLICLSPGNNSALITVHLQTSLKQKLEKWNQIYGADYGFLSAGFSCSHLLKDLNTAISEAEEAHERLFYMEEQPFFISDGVALKTEFPASFTKELEMTVTELARKYDSRKGLNALLQFTETARDFPLKISVYKKILENFYGKLCQECRWTTYWTSLSEELADCKNAYAYAGKIINICDFHRKHPGKADSSEPNYSHTVRLAVEYMKLHYSEQITVSDVSEAVQKSPNYFSSIFKKETGLSFSKYLNELRLERAKWMLLHTSRQVSEIYEAVGYTDYIYFSQLFRKKFGCSASEMRSKTPEASSRTPE